VSGPLDIQKVALGVPDLLGLAGGVTPESILKEVRGSLDLLDNYLLQRRLGTSAITQLHPNATGWWPFAAPSTLTVPQSKALMVYSAFTTVITGAASTFTGALAIKRASFQTLPGYTFIDGHPWQMVANDSATFGRYFERPVIMLPGDELGLLINVFTGTMDWPAVYVDYAAVGI